MMTCSDAMRDALVQLSQCDGSDSNVASAEVLAARVRNIAKAALGAAREDSSIAATIEACAKIAADYDGDGLYPTSYEDQLGDASMTQRHIVEAIRASAPMSVDAPQAATVAQTGFSFKWAVETVLNKFRADEAAGYRSKDRQYAISILGKAMDVSSGAQTAQVTFEDPRNVTAADREYASELLADLTSDDLPRLEIAARWLRKARVEHSLPGNHAQAPMQADIAQIIHQGWANGKTSVELAEEILREFASPVPSTQRGDVS